MNQSDYINLALTKKDSPETFLNVNKILVVMSIDNYQARQMIAEKKKSGGLINAAGRKKVLSVVIVDNGSVVASPLPPDKIVKAIRLAEKEKRNEYIINLSEGDSQNERQDQG